MKVGTVFDQTSTTEFLVMLDQQYDSEQLLFSYVEVSPDGGQPNPDDERIIGRITNVLKENPLLSRDQAGVLASVSTEALGLDFSRRFTRGWAKCTVIGTLTGRGLDMNRRAISPNAEVHTPSIQTLRQLFFNPDPSYVPLGLIETFSGQGMDEVPVTLNADQMVTKHFCIFGMTGSGKTNTAAKLIEELMARGHRMIIFDSHDDYANLEEFTSLFSYKDDADQQIQLTSPISHGQAVQEALNQFNPTTAGSRPIEEYTYERLLRVASVIYRNTPIRQFLQGGNQRPVEGITPAFVTEIAQSQPWSRLISNPQVRAFRCFPELKFYGDGFQDFTIMLLQAFQGEAFTSAQWRWLVANIEQAGTGINYLQNLWRAANSDRDLREDTKEVLKQRFNSAQRIYKDALSSGTQPLDFEAFFRQVADRANGDPQTVYRLSLTDLSSNLRKAVVYGVVTYFFRAFKFGGFRAQAKGNQPANAYPLLFVLEEARSLIPRSSGLDDADVSGRLARNAMRELAYEGRKFSLGFGLISQKPSTIDPEVVSQSNTFILHQLKSPDDQEYVRAVTESMSRDELDLVKSLGTGRAIIAGLAVESPVLLRVYPRYSQEGIQEPTPVQDELQTGIERIRQQLGISETKL
jgi:DNA helicase HerA-like ATPase